eukprot:TRINITY_DN51846_c0_g1_i1.p1 TRINITY_DN51846_c0_g1~~TRINITY_DN51846_c0_g1_i1.p1  ORF type:complete len:577 (-),score=112.20 TRINITY_DN51846_c0_g1_i1:219-1949(-)
MDGSEDFKGNEDAESINFASLSKPILASKVRLYPSAWHRHPSARVEIHLLEGEAAANAAVEYSSADGIPRQSIELLKAQLSLALRASAALRSVEEEKLRGDSLASEKAVKERGELEIRLAESLARAATAEAALFQQRAERERLEEFGAKQGLELKQLQEKQNTGQGSVVREENERLTVAVEDLSEQLLVVCDERDIARKHEEELFHVINGKDEELLLAHQKCSDLTQQLQEKHVHNYASDLLTDEMAELNKRLQELQVSHSEVLHRCQRLEEENRAVAADRDRALRKKEKLDKQKQELLSKLELSEQARQAARERCEQLLQSREKQKAEKVAEKDRKRKTVTGINLGLGSEDVIRTVATEVDQLSPPQNSSGVGDLSGRSNRSHRSNRNSAALGTPPIAAGGGIAAVEAIAAAAEAWSSLSPDSGERSEPWRSAPMPPQSLIESPEGRAELGGVSASKGQITSPLPVFGLDSVDGLSPCSSMPNSGRSSRSQQAASPAPACQATSIPSFGGRGAQQAPAPTFGASSSTSHLLLPPSPAFGTSVTAPSFGSESRMDAMERVSSAPHLRPASATSSRH